MERKGEGATVLRPSPSGNGRLGFILGGALLLFLGLGGTLLFNLLLHAMAPPGGMHLLFLKVYPIWGLYSSFLAVLGVLATLIGGGMIWLGSQMPRGPFSLPDTEGLH